jgi:hypothetical protein
MNRKGIAILSSVVVVCAAGMLVSHFVDWSVDQEGTGGDIGKSSRFSRTADTERITNLEELIRSDEDYKNSLVAAYTVMQARAMQFDALLTMSNEVAGDIPEFSDILKAMNGIRPMINNVSTSLAMAGTELDASLAGESRPDLTQRTINATLAYTTLQKQNKLADRFISTTDRYLKKEAGNDRLKFVRDEWVDYQLLTAALNGDVRETEELKEKGMLLQPEQSVSALNSFDALQQVAILGSARVADALEVDNQLAAAIPPELIAMIPLVIARTAEAAAEAAGDSPRFGYNELSQAAGGILADVSGQMLGKAPYQDVVMLKELPIELKNADGENSLGLQLLSFGHLPKVLLAGQSIFVRNTDDVMDQNVIQGNDVGSVISQTALGMRGPK